MFSAIFFAIVDPQTLSGLSAIGTFALWLRVEHRLTKIETKLGIGDK